MISFVVKTCTSCGFLSDTICSIDNVLASYGKNGWQNISLLTSKPTPYVKIRQLIYYKEILNNLRWNQDFYCPYGMDNIVARVKQLTAGESTIAKRWILPTYTTTTSTTTTSTTSTSTSSTTTTTTSHTTTTTSTSSTSSTTTTTNTTIGPSTWSLSISSGLSGILNIQVNSITVVNQSTSSSGVLTLSPGDQVVAAVSTTVPSTICLTMLPNHPTPACVTGDFGHSSSIGPITVLPSTAYTIIATIGPKTTTTTTTTSTTTTTTTTP